MNRQELIDKLKRQGYSAWITDAFSRVDRSVFVLPEYENMAYADTALPIGYGQTVSQPSTIAFMLSLLNVRSGQKILEVGFGSGYVLALLAEMAGKSEIIGTERIEELAERGRSALAAYGNVRTEYTPHGIGLPEEAPFDRILVSAAAASTIPPALVAQLREGGIIVCPVGNAIIKAVKTPDGIITEEHSGFAFVELYENGRHGRT